MNVTSHRVGILGVLFLGGALWAGTGASMPPIAPSTSNPSPSNHPRRLSRLPMVNRKRRPSKRKRPSPRATNVRVPTSAARKCAARRDDFGLRADYLMWWTSGMTLPPLVTTGTTANPTSTVLFGNDVVNDGGRSGFRTTVGMWLDCRHSLGRRVRLFGARRPIRQLQPILHRHSDPHPTLLQCADQQSRRRDRGFSWHDLGIGIVWSPPRTTSNRPAYR